MNEFPYRTKWKRQNQLRLEQLRHQASLEKEYAATEGNDPISLKCF